MSYVNLDQFLTNPSFNSGLFNENVTNSVLTYSNQQISGIKTFTGIIDLTDPLHTDLVVSGNTSLSDVTVNGTITNTNLSNQLALLATDSEVVHLAGTESITGTKTFTNATFGSSNANTLVVNSSSTFNNNVILGSTQADTLVINATSNFENSVTIGSSQADTLTVKATPTFQNGISISGASTIGSSSADSITFSGTPSFSTGITVGGAIESNGLINVGKSLFSNGTMANALLQYANPLSGVGTFTEVGTDGYIYTYGPTSDLNSQQMLRWSNNPNANVTSFMGEIVCTSIVSGSALQIGNGANGGGTGSLVQIKSIGTSDLQCDTISINETINLMPITYITNFTSDPQSQITALYTSGNSLNGRITTLENDIPNLAPINAPVFTGLPTCPTATSGSNATFQIANTQFVLEQIADLVNSSPANLSTLSQIATSLGDSTNLASTLTNAIALKADLSALTAFESTTATNLAGKQPLLSSSTPLTVSSFTSSSIVDNGNLSVKGNTTLGDSYTDTLQINAITTFATQPTFSAGNIVAGTVLQTAVNGLATSFSNKLDNSTYTTDQATLVTSLAGKQPLLSNTTNLTVGGFTSNSIVDNGNLSVKGNTTLGDSYTDTLTINAITTFATQPTFSAGNIVAGTVLQTAVNGLATSLSNKVDTTTYANDMSLLAPILSPNFSGTPQCNNCLPLAYSHTIANTNYVDSAVSVLTYLAPTNLNTFKEVAYAINNDPNYFSTVNTALAGKQSTISGSTALTCGNFQSSSIVDSGNLSVSGNTIIGATLSPDTLQVNAITNFASPPTMLGTNITGIPQAGVNGLSTSLSNKVNQTTYSTDLALTNASIALLAPILSPAFTSIPTAPTASASTNNTQLATTAYCDNAVAVLVGSAPSYLNTLGEIATSLNDQTNLAVSLTTNIASKVSQTAYDANNITLNASIATKQNTISGSTALTCGNLSSSSITDTGNCTIQGNTNIGNQTTDSCNFFTGMTISGLQIAHVTGLSSTLANIPQANVSGLSSTLATYTTLSAVQSNSNTFTNASNTFSYPPYMSGSNISSATIPQNAINGLSTLLQYVDATSSIQTQLNSKTTLSAIQSNSNTFSNASNTFSNPPYLSGANITSASIPQSSVSGLITSLQYLDATSSIQTQLNAKTTLSAIQANSNTFSNASNTFSNPPYLSGANITSATIPQSSVSGLTTSLQYLDATSSIQTQLTSKTTLSAIQSNANTFSGNLVSQSTLNIMEKVTAVTVSSNIATINYASGGVYYITPAAATNFQIVVTNVNPASSTTTTCIVTLLINTSTYLCYGNTCSINGTSLSIKFAGGSSNVSITSGTLVQQSLSIVYSGSSTVPVVVMSSVVPFY